MPRVPARSGQPQPAAAHHPLSGQLVAVVRRKRHEGEPHLVINTEFAHGARLDQAHCDTLESFGL